MIKTTETLPREPTAVFHVNFFLEKNYKHIEVGILEGKGGPRGSPGPRASRKQKPA